MIIRLFANTHVGLLIKFENLAVSTSNAIVAASNLLPSLRTRPDLRAFHRLRRLWSPYDAVAYFLRAGIVTMAAEGEDTLGCLKDRVEPEVKTTEDGLGRISNI